MDVQIIMLLIALFGGIASGVLGWLESDEPFNPRKFAGTIMRSLFSAGVAFLAFADIVNPNVFTYVMVFLAGAGIDYLGVDNGLKFE